MQEEQFIESVRGHEELYNKRNKYYMDTKRKENIWLNLSEKFTIDAKKKWQVIRDRYVREKKKHEQPSGSQAEYIPQWHLFEMLKFLDDCLQPRRTRENSGSSEVSGTSSTSGEIEEEINEAISETECSRSKSTSGHRKRKSQDTVDLAILESLSKFNKRFEDLHTQKDNEDDLFLKSIKFQMEKMTEDQKTNYKVQMLLKANEAVKISVLNKRQ